MAKYRKSLLDIIKEEDSIITQIETLNEDLAKISSQIRDIEYNKAEYSYRLDAMKEIRAKNERARYMLEEDLEHIHDELKNHCIKILESGCVRIDLGGTNE